MSTPTAQQGKNVPLLLSTDNVTFKTLVCETAHDITVDSPVSEESTDCGKLATIDVPSFVMTFGGVISTTPNSATEMSFDGLWDIVEAGTAVYLRTTHSHRQIVMYGYINNFQTTKATQELLKYSFTFTASGAPTTTVV